jgi:hypothetical protein
VRFHCAGNKSRKQISVIALFRQHLSAALVVSRFLDTHTHTHTRARARTHTHTHTHTHTQKHVHRTHAGLPTTPCDVTTVAVAAVIDDSSIGGLPRSRRSKAHRHEVARSNEFLNRAFFMSCTVSIVLPGRSLCQENILTVDINR